MKDIHSFNIFVSRIHSSMFHRARTHAFCRHRRLTTYHFALHTSRSGSLLFRHINVPSSTIFNALQLLYYVPLCKHVITITLRRKQNTFFHRRCRASLSHKHNILNHFHYSTIAIFYLTIQTYHHRVDVSSFIFNIVLLHKLRIIFRHHCHYCMT